MNISLDERVDNDQTNIEKGPRCHGVVLSVYLALGEALFPFRACRSRCVAPRQVWQRVPRKAGAAQATLFQEGLCFGRKVWQKKGRTHKNIVPAQQWPGD